MSALANTIDFNPSSAFSFLNSEPYVSPSSKSEYVPFVQKLLELLPSVPSCISADSFWLAETLSDLEETISLEQGWNGYDAPPPEALPIQYASLFIETLSRTNLKPTHVGPTVMGGIAISFRSDGLEIFLEFYNDGQIYGMFADDNDPDDLPRVEPFSPEGFSSSLIPEIQGFLNA